MVPTYLSAACGEAFQGQGVQDVEEFDSVDALFLFDGGRRRQGKKEKEKRREKQPKGKRVSQAEPLFLAVPWVTAVWCN
jgi:hypothetical protein